MQIREILTEKAVGSLNIDGILLVVDDHAFDRARQRDISPHDVDLVIKKLPKIKDVLSSFESGNTLWVFDTTLNVSLGLRRVSSSQLKFSLKTLVGKLTYISDVPVIRIT